MRSCCIWVKFFCAWYYFWYSFNIWGLLQNSLFHVYHECAILCHIFWLPLVLKLFKSTLWLFRHLALCTVETDSTIIWWIFNCVRTKQGRNESTYDETKPKLSGWLNWLRVIVTSRLPPSCSQSLSSLNFTCAGHLYFKRKRSEDEKVSFKAPCEQPNCKRIIIIATDDNRQFPLFPWVRKKSRDDCFNLRASCHTLLLLATSKYPDQ